MTSGLRQLRPSRGLWGDPHFPGPETGWPHPLRKPETGLEPAKPSRSAPDPAKRPRKSETGLDPTKRRAIRVRVLALSTGWGPAGFVSREAAEVHSLAATLSPLAPSNLVAFTFRTFDRSARELGRVGQSGGQRQGTAIAPPKRAARPPVRPARVAEANRQTIGLGVGLSSQWSPAESGSIPERLSSVRTHAGARDYLVYQYRTRPASQSAEKPKTKSDTEPP